jgi:hypothetical protein
MYFADRPRAQKSETTALVLSLGTTAAGVATIALAVDSQDESQAILGLGMALVGPSLGHLYAGELGHAVLFTGLRVGGLALAAAALDQGGRDNETIAAIGISLAGAATLYDLIDAPRAVDRYNREGGLLIMPTALPTSAGPAMGMSLGGSF